MIITHDTTEKYEKKWMSKRVRIFQPIRSLRKRCHSKPMMFLQEKVIQEMGKSWLFQAKVNSSHRFKIQNLQSSLRSLFCILLGSRFDYVLIYWKKLYISSWLHLHIVNICNVFLSVRVLYSSFTLTHSTTHT